MCPLNDIRKITSATASTVAATYSPAISSVVERPTDNREVMGSSPISRTAKIRVPSKAPKPRPIAMTLRERWRLSSTPAISGAVKDQQSLQNSVARCDTGAPDYTQIPVYTQRQQRPQRQRWGASTDRFSTL